MLDFIGNSISISAGMELELTVPVDVESRMGKFALKGKHALTGNRELLNGFGIKFPEVGELSKIKDDDDEDSVGTKVLYKHLKSERNTIWFFALTGEIGVIEIVSVPIHDHSSIVSGGPAYGTYYSEFAALKEEKLEEEKDESND